MRAHVKCLKTSALFPTPEVAKKRTRILIAALFATQNLKLQAGSPSRAGRTHKSYEYSYNGISHSQDKMCTNLVNRMENTREARHKREQTDKVHNPPQLIYAGRSQWAGSSNVLVMACFWSVVLTSQIRLVYEIYLSVQSVICVLFCMYISFSKMP